MMKYRLEIYNIWELGRREKQEDSLYPEFGKAKNTDRLFILCDGMGGHSAGEVASSVVCQAISQSIFQHCPDAEGAFSEIDFKTALDDAYDALDSIDDGSPKKMGTTLAFLKFHSNGIIIAHIGDSRVYHIRPGKDTNDTNILFQTRDHSLVNDLIKIGELTPEEAKYSRQKNVITRAMQPNMDHHPKADLYHTQDIQPGDYFMLCSDGILEQMEDNHLQFIFSDKGGSAKNKVDMLRKVTANNRDNHSAILVHVLGIHTMNEKDEVEEKEYMLSSSTFEDNIEKENKEVIFSTARINTNHYPLRWGIMFLIIIFLVVCGYICLRIFEPTLG